jgi:Carbonic anhydrase
VVGRTRLERGDNPADASTIPDSGRNADDSLQRLKAGNARFVAGMKRFPTMRKEILAELAKGQHPYATILSCSDSRVPPELIFDAGLGELFIIRIAGNVLSPEIGEVCNMRSGIGKDEQNQKPVTTVRISNHGQRSGISQVVPNLLDAGRCECGSSKS